jgi:hypothetical protein
MEKAMHDYLYSLQQARLRSQLTVGRDLTAWGHRVSCISADPEPFSGQHPLASVPIVACWA